ncbi:MAG: BA14K family protein [Alphaproteobacteria bacterium]|nr:BA14K family protein [Alphaproteobacteria bacterium]
MRKFIAIVSAAAFVGASALAGIAPASAAPWHSNYQQQDRYIGTFCDRNPNASQCNDWRMNRSQWGDSQYQSFYQVHRSNSVFASNFIAGVFGFALGATISGMPASTSAHVRACQDRYRSYNVRTDSFLGYDGFYHLCRL